MSTIHNPTQFDPADYSVIGYFDNQPPRVHVGCRALDSGDTTSLAAEWEHLIMQWRDERIRLFGDADCYRCYHCGQRNVRYVAAVKHIPTGETVCFGDICCDRLALPDRSTFQAKHLRDRASHQMAADAKYAAALKFLDENPGFKQLLEQSADPVHKNNTFVANIKAAVAERGFATGPQMAAVKASIARDLAFAATNLAFAATKAQAQAARELAGRGDVPEIKEGAYEITGQVASIKEVFNEMYGSSWKMLVIDADTNKFWVSVPTVLRGSDPYDMQLFGRNVRLTANWEKSKTDAHFAFGKRPRKAEKLPE